ncbi:MAG TPA: hypothetical protein VF821_24395 [Lentzea sp.]
MSGRQRGGTGRGPGRAAPGVVGNLEEQVPNPDLAMILRATAHYVDNDAFIELP